MIKLLKKRKGNPWGQIAFLWIFFMCLFLSKKDIFFFILLSFFVSERIFFILFCIRKDIFYPFLYPKGYSFYPFYPFWIFIYPFWIFIYPFWIFIYQAIIEIAYCVSRTIDKYTLSAISFTTSIASCEMILNDSSFILPLRKFMIAL